MNNEINGVTVSNIGIYMCIDDPLNIYSTINNPTQDIVLTDQQLNIQNFNELIHAYNDSDWGGEKRTRKSTKH